MKIVSQNIITGTEPEKTPARQKTTGVDFSNILQDAMATSSKPEESAMTLPPVQNIPNIVFDQIQNVDTTQSIKRVDQFIDLLEAYQDKLGDSNSTLKDVSSLISSIESETENITPLLDSLSEDDALKDVLNRAIAVSYTHLTLPTN